MTDKKNAAEEKIWRKAGLTDSEYALLTKHMGREPNTVELALYAQMWSEHCGYTHTRPLFKHFPTSGPRILQGPGENAGIVDIDDDEVLTFKVESHNHPSAIAPFQGAATGAKFESIADIFKNVFGNSTSGSP